MKTNTGVPLAMVDILHFRSAVRTDTSKFFFITNAQDFFQGVVVFFPRLGACKSRKLTGVLTLMTS